MLPMQSLCHLTAVYGTFTLLFQVPVTLLTAALCCMPTPAHPLATFTGSQAANHLDQDVVLDLVVGDTAAAHSLEDWLCRYAYCVTSLCLALNTTTAQWSVRRQSSAMHDILSGLHSAAASAAAAQRPLQLAHLTLEGEMATYGQLGSLLAALPRLQGLQLTSDLESRSDEVVIAAEDGCLQQQLRTGLAGLHNLRALRIDPYLPGLGAAGLRGVLPPSLTALTLVVDDAIGRGELGHLVNLQKLHITDPCEHLGPHDRDGRPAGMLEDVRSIAALPALQQVTVGERQLSWAAMQRLLPKLVALTSLQSYLDPEVMQADCTRQLTAMTALELRLSSGALVQGLELDSITGLRRLRLELPENPALVEGVLQQAGRLTQLEDLCVDLTTEDMEMGMALHSVHLPAGLTGFHLRVRCIAAPSRHYCVCTLKLMQVLCSTAYDRHLHCVLKPPSSHPGKAYVLS